MKRIIALNPFVNLIYMQVCAEKDVTDEEILDFCNLENPSGTSYGWATVIREGEGQPIECESNPGRLHFLVGC